MSSSQSMNPTLKFQPTGTFARDVNRRAHAALAGMPRYGDMTQWALTAGFAAIGFAAYGRLLTGMDGASGSAACIAAAAFCAFMMIVQIGHDASHGTVSRHLAVNRAALFWSFAVLGVDGALWGDRHIRLHHRVVNLPGTGIDADSVSLFRLAPDKPWHWWNRLQPVYGPMLYTVGHISLAWIEDFVALRAQRRAGRHAFAGPGALAKFAAGKAVHAGLFLVVPWLVLRPSAGGLLLGYLFATALISVCFVALVVGTHITDLAEFPVPDATGTVPYDWATHQVVTSVDWAPESRLAVLFSGGANAHVAHHLFPGYNHRHMAAVSRIVADTAAEHGLQHRVTTFTGMILGQWRHLVAMSRPPQISGDLSAGR